MTGQRQGQKWLCLFILGWLYITTRNRAGIATMEVADLLALNLCGGRNFPGKTKITS